MSEASQKPVLRRRRGQARLRVLLDAASALLGEQDVAGIGLYQIAERAAVPPASIYHFFPNREAAIVALAEDYLAKLVDLARQPLPKRPRSWQEFQNEKVVTSAAYFNSQPGMMNLFLGAGSSTDIHHRDMVASAAIAEVRAEALNQYFVMPAVGRWLDYLTVSVALVEGIWSLSFSRHRAITPDYVHEAQRASVAYLRCFLPEHVDPRPA